MSHNVQVWLEYSSGQRINSQELNLDVCSKWGFVFCPFGSGASSFFIMVTVRVSASMDLLPLSILAWLFLRGQSSGLWPLKDAEIRDCDCVVLLVC